MPLIKSQNSIITKLTAENEPTLESISMAISLDAIKKEVLLPIKDKKNKKCFVTLYKGEPKVFEANCPHMGADLSSGICSESKIICPWHGYSFNLKDGIFNENPNVSAMSKIRVLSENFDPDLKVIYKLVQRSFVINNNMLEVENDT
jgi:nitrite reductase/ring-hydroxylating ferredoxin subunit